MYEESVIGQLTDAGVDLVISLPCDRNKRFTDMVHQKIRTIDITKEEDAVGISAGAYMGGSKPVVSIQSSGLGNMMNAIMSLSDCYRLPLVILSSWRGVDDEKIEAQKHFNLRIPKMLDAFEIGYTELSEPGDIENLSKAIDKAFREESILVVLIRPKLWCSSERIETEYPSRERFVSVKKEKHITGIHMSRLEAIKIVMDSIDENTVIVSNIGVPSKETFSAGDRDLNFYMMGSFGQATPIGLGLALSTGKNVVVIDGEGSLLTDNILPVVGFLKPKNLKIICMDNGTYGSTGNQINMGYSSADIGLIAMASGIKNVYDTVDGKEIRKIISADENAFVQFLIRPGNSKSPNIDMKATDIKKRFMKALRP